MPPKPSPESLLREQLAAQNLLRGMEPGYPFGTSIGKDWSFTFAWPDQRIAIEVDHAIAIRGKRLFRRIREADCYRNTMAAAFGWRVAHVTPAQIKSGAAVRWAAWLLKVEAQAQSIT